MSIRTEGLDHAALSVSDLEDSERWYRDVLGLERAYPDLWDGVPAILVAGGSGVALFPARSGGTGEPGIRVLHLAFRTDRAGFEAAQEELRARGIEFHFQDHVAHSIYFRDPDGHQLELTTYELTSHGAA